jgi:hypothetical protein
MKHNSQENSQEKENDVQRSTPERSASADPHDPTLSVDEIFGAIEVNLR